MPDGYEVSISQVVYMVDSTLLGIPIMSVCLVIWHSIGSDHVQRTNQVVLLPLAQKVASNFWD